MFMWSFGPLVPRVPGPSASKQHRALPGAGEQGRAAQGADDTSAPRSWRLGSAAQGRIIVAVAI